MELTLKRLLEHAEFKKYRGKGYDPTEVDDFLDRAAAMAGKVEVQLTQALEKAKAGGGGGGEPVPEVDIEAEVERRVAERLAQAPSGPSEDESAEEVRRTLVMAQRTADAAVREAREDAEKILSAANEQAAALVADAEARSEALTTEADQYRTTTREAVDAEAATERRAARQRLAAEIGELEGLRETLRSDVSVLERHVEEQRSQLGSTLAELQQILDDPSGFRMAPAPALADPDLPDFSDLAEPEPEPEPEPDADPAPVEPQPEPEAEAEPEAEPEAAAEPVEEIDLTEPDESDPPAPPAVQALSFDEVDHEAPGLDDPLDGGPPTAPISVVDLGAAEAEAQPQVEDDDAFLAELRKAMADDEPLGPRDTDERTHSDALFEDDDRRGWRFGRRH